MTRNTTAQICRVTTTYIAPSENIICAPPKRGVDQCELAVAAKLMVALRIPWRTSEPLAAFPRPPQRSYGGFEGVIFAR
jgi:hypothetical protein